MSALAPFLIEPAELLAAAAPPVVVDTRPAREYDAGHIPGAINLSTYDLFVPGTRPAELAAFRDEVARRFEQAGLARERAIVVYEGATGMRAARELWILEYLGHANARMLHGGFAGWIAAGGATARDAVRLPQTRLHVDAAPAVVIGCDEIVTELRSGARYLLDVRDCDEFNGRDKTPCCARRGRLPGAVWLEWTELLNAQGRFRPPAEVITLLARKGVTADREIVPYCHRGARSANTYYALRAAGLTAVRNYIGSWHDWSARSDLPLEV